MKKIIRNVITIILCLAIAPVAVLTFNEIHSAFYIINKKTMEKQQNNGTYIEKNTKPIGLPGMIVYINYQSDSSLSLDENLNWLYDCKLYQDFGSCPDAYLIITSHDDISDARSENTESYYSHLEGNPYRYIFVTNLRSLAVIHELAHFADDIHGFLSLKQRWVEIYEKEWIYGCV